MTITDPISEGFMSASADLAREAYNDASGLRLYVNPVQAGACRSMAGLVVPMPPLFVPGGYTPEKDLVGYYHGLPVYSHYMTPNGQVYAGTDTDPQPRPPYETSK